MSELDYNFAILFETSKMRDWQLKKQKLLDEGIRFPSPANMSKEEKVMSRDSCPENRIFDSMSILTYAHS